MHDNNLSEIQLKKKVMLLKNAQEKKLCEVSYAQFVKSSWEILEPENPLIWNWHYDYLCDEVQKQITRIAERRKREYHLIVNIPPRSLKSMIFTRMASAWAWIHYPWMRFIRTSYAEELAIEHAVETRTIIKDEWYQKKWGDRFRLKVDQDNKSHFRTNFNGAVITSSTGAKITGRGGNVVSFDDPISPEQAFSETELKKHIRYYRITMKSRINNRDIDMFWIIMQRLHQEDLTGWVMTNEPDKYKVICLPVEDCDWVQPAELRKYYCNGLLHPERFTRAFCDESRKENAFVYAGQYMQRPSPEEGGLFKRKNWAFWQPKGMNLPPVKVRVGLDEYTCDLLTLPDSFDDSVCSWDLAFKGNKDNDPVSGHVIAAAGSYKYFLDENHGNKTYAESCKAVIKLRKKWPLTSQVLIEDKANGPALMQDLDKFVEGLYAVPSNGRENTYTNAQIMAKDQESHKIVLPHPDLCSWTEPFIEDYTAYPNGAHDDRVSSGAQGVVRLRSVKLVFPMFKNRRVRVKINWQEINRDKKLYISQYVETDLSCSIILAVWNSRKGLLVVFDEMKISTSTIPEIIKHALEVKIQRLSGGALKDLSLFEWFGNAFMFGRTTSSSTRAMQRTSVKDTMSMAYQDSGIDVIDNVMFDESTAITQLSKIMLKKRLLFDERAPECSRQAASWFYENDKTSEGFGYIRALINLYNFMEQERLPNKVMRAPKEFSQEKMAMKKRLENSELNAEIGDVPVYSSTYEISQNDGTGKKPTSWII